MGFPLYPGVCMLHIRRATDQDRPALDRILAASPEAGQWSQLDLSRPRRCLVADGGPGVVGVLLASCPVPDEAEILALAVDPAHRRRGAASALLGAFLESRHGRVFLEVRASNRAARRLYSRFGFRQTAVRPLYYQTPAEDALIFQLLCP